MISRTRAASARTARMFGLGGGHRRNRLVHDQRDLAGPGRQPPLRITWRLPITEIGTIGSPACIAR